MKRKKVQFISRRSKGAGGGGANGLTEDVSISANGRLAAFETAADNLGGPIATLAGDTNVYVYNLERKKVVLVSRRSKGAGGQGGDDESEDPAIAPSGPFVAFETEAQNLGGPNQLVGRRGEHLPAHAPVGIDRHPRRRLRPGWGSSSRTTPPPARWSARSRRSSRARPTASPPRSPSCSPSGRSSPPRTAAAI